MVMSDEDFEFFKFNTYYYSYFIPSGKNITNFIFRFEAIKKHYPYFTDTDSTRLCKKCYIRNIDGDCIQPELGEKSDCAYAGFINFIYHNKDFFTREQILNWLEEIKLERDL